MTFRPTGRTILPFALALSLLAAHAAAVAAAPAAGRGAAARESKRLRALLDEAWARKLSDRPEFATYIGHPGYNHRWMDLSAAGIERRRAFARDHLARARALDRALLSPDEQIDLELYVRRLAAQIEGFAFLEDETVLSRYDGVQLYAPQVFGLAPLGTVRDAEDAIARLRGLPAHIDQVLALLAKGLAGGATPPKSLLDGVPEQVRTLVPDDPWQSPLLARFRQLPGGIEDEDAARLRSGALYAYERAAAPAFRKLLAYLTATYIPAARTSLGMSALPDGAAWYAHRLRGATTTDRSPKELHELGLAEVARLRAEMERIKSTAGFSGSLAEFTRFLRSDPRFVARDGDALLDRYRATARQIEERLPTLFRTIPSLPLRFAAVPAAEAPGRSPIYYEPGSVAQGKPGVCAINTFDLAARPTWEIAAHALHECLPGHHLQVTIAQSIRKPAKVLNYHDYTPFVEGWGVYAETLGDELGLYSDPYAKFGQLTSELWRAMRLVVDTGIHSQGWTRQQAVDFFRAQTGMDERAIDVEIERYLAEPGIGTAYTVGLLEFRALRELARRELGAAFDVRDFHDVVLRHGALPLDLLAGNVRAWIAEVRGAETRRGAATPSEGSPPSGRDRLIGGSAESGARRRTSANATFRAPRSLC